ncbi:hypothetical protein OH76DRAFT_823195 [Lentinus brumalis]|uniref:Secreted protein n=1 Tax=Lentinus brumalis TaxID=2498619 RepID=A0A371D2B5_9APHY|nr:hypothetical protein OH76DRAFT_823195 [Polyporus brumalis]
MTPSSRTWPILAPFLLLRAAIVSRESVPTASWTVEWLLPTVRLSFPLRWVPESYSIRPIHDLWRLRGAPNCATASHSLSVFAFWPATSLSPVGTRLTGLLSGGRTTRQCYISHHPWRRRLPPIAQETCAMMPSNKSTSQQPLLSLSLLCA